MEWGNFWSSHLPRTSYDIDLDAESSNANDMVIFAILPCFSDLVLRY
jgi:hexokinase